MGNQIRRAQEGRHQNYLFNADDGMVVSSEPILLQGEFSTLVRMFNREGLKINVRKKFGMV